MSNFVDECGLNVKGGDGGAGCIAFRREAHVPMGGPDGGDGGKGGDVWLVADRNVASLLAFRDHPHRKATSGTHGSGKKKHGRSGEDLMVPVPVGTSVNDRDGRVLADLVNHGDRWLAAEGVAAARATPGSCPTSVGRPGSPSRARLATSAGCGSSSSSWPTSRSSATPTWASPR